MAKMAREIFLFAFFIKCKDNAISEMQVVYCLSGDHSIQNMIIFELVCNKTKSQGTRLEQVNQLYFGFFP